MAPRIYHLHPLVAGKLADWSKHFARCRAMGFDIVCVAPPFAPGQGGDIFITADYERLHPALGWEGSADEGLTRVAKLASEHGLRLWLDLTIDQVAADAGIRQQQPLWFTSGDFAGPTTPWRAPQRHDVAYARLDQTDIAEAMGTWWLDRLGRLTQAGIAGFRCLAPHRTPASFWRRAIEALKQHAECRFLAWTPAIERPLLPRLAGVGFDQVCCSLGWWDGRAHWLVEEYEILRRIAPVLASPEPSFHERLVNRLPPDADIATAYRLSLRLAAAVGSGMLIPMGFEYAARPGFDSVVAGPDDFRRIQDEAPCDLAAEIAAANSLVNDDTDGGMRQLTGTLDTVTALLKTDASDPRFASRGVLVLANPDIKRSAAISLPLSPLPPQAGVALVLADSTNEADGPLGAGEVRVLPYAPTEPVRYPAMRDSDLRGSELAQSRVVIEAVRPAAGGVHSRTDRSA
jgi:starch synthase (maltosyl-transferring)